jgi:cytidylate kinase
MIVAIDGPAGAGKSSVALALSTKLGFQYVDTGAMYRALTWLALERRIHAGDAPALEALAVESRISFRDGRVSIAGRDVSRGIRAARIDRAVSTVAAHPGVRRVMRERQRELAQAGDAVVEGRDIGTVVFPDADLKVYLVADPDERARRRQAERPDAGDTATDLRLRDARDAGQMEMASDAELIDTTSLTLDEVVARIESLVAARQAPRAR